MLAAPAARSQRKHAVCRTSYLVRSAWQRRGCIAHGIDLQVAHVDEVRIYIDRVRYQVHQTDRQPHVTVLASLRALPEFGSCYVEHTSTMSNPEKERYRSATSNSIVFAFSRREPWSHTITPTVPAPCSEPPPTAAADASLASPSTAAALAERRGRHRDGFPC